jgi:hypothetical protein
MGTLPAGPFGAYIFSSDAATVPFTSAGLSLGVTETNNDAFAGLMTLN